MLQHSFYNCICSFTVMVYFFGIELNVFRNSFYFIQVSFLCFRF